MSDQVHVSFTRRLARRLHKWFITPILIVIAVLLTLVLVQAFASRSMPDLESWHQRVPDGEFTKRDLKPEYDLAQYLQNEQWLFDQLPGYMLEPDDLKGHSSLCRYVSGGSQNPARQPINWNRTVEMKPEEPKGGILLLHGLSDSPYSLRSQAEFFFNRNFYVLVMRMPGHGTVPSGLLNVSWKDWSAAVKVGTRSVLANIDDSMPFFIGGFSNGGALAVNHSLDVILEGTERVPDRLFLFSPAIGITAFARIARWDALYGFIPYFEKSKWLDLEPEFDPYKYNSFPKNAGTQSWGLAHAIQSKLSVLQNQGSLDKLPHLLAFQSVVDATVVAPDLVRVLFDRVQRPGSELVYFDINHASYLDGFLSTTAPLEIDALMQRTGLKYAITRVTNFDTKSLAMVARTKPSQASSFHDQPLDLQWPKQVFSLAHVSIPFPPDDPLYGSTPPDTSDPLAFGMPIGQLSPLGERHVLTIPASQFIRIRHNPFHAYMMQRIEEAIEE
ncbi:MAG: alpha/beta hydrolase [Planctomycetota bacterium]|nr:alpha/beta hydrolase [Planctomycetota bacterium]